ncbi:hypothetical protein [Lentzea pudingi]|uniref:hypothetical protein n=1 Tax=Lentzea pudingi TaxID=1789439 RepID=UPI001666A252|nr:hypothetical protein [Lentzea pudingi]
MIGEIYTAIVLTERAAEEATPIFWKAVDHHVVVDGVQIGEFRSAGHARFAAWNAPIYAVRRTTTDRMTLHKIKEVIGDRDLSRYGEPGLLDDDPNALAVTLAAETVINLAAAYDHGSESRL